MDEIETDNQRATDPNKPGKGRYILGWFVWAILNSIASFVVGFTVVTIAGAAAYSWGFWVIFMPIVSVATAVGIFYLNYRVIFKSLNPWRVMPYVYTLGTLGYIGGAGQELATLRELLPRDTTGAYAIAMICSWIVILYLIRNHVVAKSNYSK
jgi:hypothetical protein